jgi:hypothetical protein
MGVLSTFSFFSYTPQDAGRERFLLKNSKIENQ